MAASCRGSTAPRAATTWFCRPRTANCTCCRMANTARWSLTLRPPCLPIRGLAEQQRNLIAYLETLKGVAVGPVAGSLPPVTPAADRPGPPSQAGRLAHLQRDPGWDPRQQPQSNHSGQCCKAATAMGLFDPIQWPGDDPGGGRWSHVCHRQQPGLRHQREDGARDMALSAPQERIGADHR